MQGVQVRGTVRFGRTVFDRRGVQGGDTVDQCHRRVSVEGDVVDPAVPQVPFVTDAQQRRLAQVVVFEIHSCRVVLVHPCLGRRHRVGCAAEVDDAHGRVGRRIDHLVWFPVDVDQAQEHRLVFVAGHERDLTEQFDVQRPTNVDVLRDADRHVRGELLRKPQPVLCRRQRERIRSMLTVGRSCGVFHQITNQGVRRWLTAGRSVRLYRAPDKPVPLQSLGTPRARTHPRCVVWAP
ncbi:hypothetical protein Rhow_000966 [Rhodococcus wratislaviensis]|uniref:Uncharacterized protein n=1 Tax=Rhodococcus wratislaviensis TaxID=44752 RepID=A0A402CMP0_RHOWR|nr:hypothetical protein Rhow_000966 [Rhodococcus wratislaviensis]